MRLSHGSFHSTQKVSKMANVETSDMKKEKLSLSSVICKRLFSSKSQARYVVLEIFLAVLILLAILFLVFIG